jgi:argininosuccinate lyase
MSEDAPLWSGRFEGKPAPEAAAFTRSLPFDRRLAPYDIAATRAHARGLERAGILTADERGAIEDCLDQALAAFEEGTFEFGPNDEDIHSAVERFLIEKLGPTGEKIHAGRSRNDLVVTDLRLWMKDTIPRIARAVFELEEALYRQARDNLDVLAPGYTHLQRAQPVLLPHLILAHLFGLARDFERLIAAYRRADVSSLGAGALAGTTLPLDAKATAEELGFKKVFDNAADAVADRDFVVEFLAAAAILGVHLSRLGEEVVVGASAEFGTIKLDDSYSTGSSIMPQKKNPDIAELTRGKSARLNADLLHVLGAMKGIPFVYSGDLQEDKEPVFDAADTLASALPALRGMVQTMSFDRDRLESMARIETLAATDIAEAMVKQGTAFRKAHETVGRLVARAEAESRLLSEVVREELGEEIASHLDARRSVEARSSHGGTSPDRIAEQMMKAEAILDDQERWLAGFGAL